MAVKVRAIINAEIGRRGYRQFPASVVEGFSIDSAMDTDADAFSIDLGAPTPDLKFLTDRDTEVRVSIFTDGFQRGTVEQLHTGIADIVGYDSSDHILSIVGRDMTSLAADSQVPPGEKKHVRPDRLVRSEALALGMRRLRLARVKPMTKFFRDSGETYWESWYRLYRQRKMWMWAEPDGSVIADKLNYAVSPTYRFGVPTKKAARRNWIPVERCAITKDAQSRVGEVWVFGDNGKDIGFMAKALDPSIRSWVKRPLKIITSSTARNKSEARTEAWEEIFEGKVGSLEIVIDVPLSETGRMVRQNYMAEINLPDMGLHGIFYIVGVNAVGGSGGYMQKIRLREQNYALSRRRPADPKLDADPARNVLPGDISDILKGAGIRWSSAFASAAQEFNGPWPFDLFLGVLLAMCKAESGFTNKRESGAREWFPMPTRGDSNPNEVGTGSLDHNQQAWREEFANEAENPLNPWHPNREAGVGAMQLTTRRYKEWADQYGGRSDEYAGGRWIADANIRAAARVLANEKLAGVDPSNPDNIWIGVERYNGSGQRAVEYRNKVKSFYDKFYKKTVENIEDQAQSVPSGKTTNVNVKDEKGNAFQVQVPEAAPEGIKTIVNRLIRQIGKPYEWGAEGPASFDCSGLVVYVYNQVGAKLGRTTYAMFADKNLENVTKDNLLPGDLIFFAKGSDVHHMGVFLNDGHFIHAPHTGDVVKISPLNAPYYREQYAGARRVLTWGGKGKGGPD